MILGTVNAEGTPLVGLPVAGLIWSAVIDTGFNSDLELPEGLRAAVNPRYRGRMVSLLGGGQMIEEDVYKVAFPCDGETVEAEASFVPGADILVGTHLLLRYRLEINFVDRTLRLERPV